ncbi:hypothetical protein DAPPUDRAFT_340824 [Daphnia pulex]|uniref:Uncharacterized protein n=1 Tax=Daphnia pulex TaxID=6669 RepID=E9I4T0_DAPPU|nr:hypothetical protein DAPPUDRAFT_340824 [Daphnia pulex]|eukprot:EFX61001.1 hypothetical protein DAPPUDRAFT_340824 [Daphnia pulex]
MAAVLCVTPIYLKSSYEFQMQPNMDNATSMDEHEQSFWYSEKMRKRQIKLEKQCAIDLQIRNLNRNITAASRNLSPGDSKIVSIT